MRTTTLACLSNTKGVTMRERAVRKATATAIVLRNIKLLIRALFVGHRVRRHERPRKVGRTDGARAMARFVFETADFR